MSVLAALDEALLGPLAGLALALLIIGLFVKGSIMSKATVPRVDYEVLRDINATFVGALGVLTTSLGVLTTSMNELVATVRHLQRNGGVH